MLLNKPNLIENARLVDDLRRAVDHCDLNNVPETMRKVLETGAWRERYKSMHVFKFERFIDFIILSPLKGGCGWEPDNVEALLAKSADAVALAMWREATTGKRGGDKKSEETKAKIIDPKPQGTSRADTLDRLKRERPDLFAKVEARKLRANAAAIEAGWRKQFSAFDHVMKLLPKLSPMERARVHDATAPAVGAPLHRAGR